MEDRKRIQLIYPQLVLFSIENKDDNMETILRADLKRNAQTFKASSYLHAQFTIFKSC